MFVFFNFKKTEREKKLYESEGETRMEKTITALDSSRTTAPVRKGTPRTGPGPCAEMCERSAITPAMSGS
jgi:hypothetical protein